MSSKGASDSSPDNLAKEATSDQFSMESSEASIEDVLPFDSHQSAWLALHTATQQKEDPINSALEAKPDPSVERKINTLIKTNLFKMIPNPMNSMGLSRPAFCPEDPNIFICGTEEQTYTRKHKNMLIFSTIDSENNLAVQHTESVSDHIRDIQWVGTQNVVFAMNQKLGFLRLGPNYNIEDLIMFPEFHKDTIREICVSQGNRNLVISGGFDGNVFVTDISRLCQDIQKNEKKSENSLYPCRDVVGSVSWHPEDEYLASCTTDPGTLHIFDIRTDKRRPAIVYDTSKKELYSHAYRDGKTILLGFGDGTIQVFDIRTKKSIFSFQDPYIGAIGEVKVNRPGRNIALFGYPSVTLWDYDESNFYGCSQHQISDSAISPHYKTSGEFRADRTTLGVTDSHGTFMLLELDESEKQ